MLWTETRNMTGIKKKREEIVKTPICGPFKAVKELLILTDTAHILCASVRKYSSFRLSPIPFQNQKQDACTADRYNQREGFLLHMYSRRLYSAIRFFRMLPAVQQALA